VSSNQNVDQEDIGEYQYQKVSLGKWPQFYVESQTHTIRTIGMLSHKKTRESEAKPTILSDTAMVIRNVDWSECLLSLGRFYTVIC
jgi:hypothetical protein